MSSVECRSRNLPESWPAFGKVELRELGAPEPALPPFDASKFEPMPEVEINPHDEFYAEDNTT